MRPFLAILVAAALGTGCFKSIALNSVADAVSGSGGAYGRDDDPELVRGAVPFGLKTMESLADQLPDHWQLREAMARGFTQYAYAFVQSDAEALPEGSPPRRALEQRASRLYARARDYGVDGMHIRAGITAVDLRRPERATALAKLQKEDVGLIYWTVASWGSQVALNKADMKIVGDLAAVDALFERALQLDEAYDKGALHELALSLLGGRAKPEALEEHYKRALDLSGGKRLSLFVSHAQAIAAPKNDKAGWKEDLEHVLHSNIDAPDARDDRLANVLAQRKARFLLDHVSDVFLDESN